MRQIILDTETTGLSPKTGHRVIEIACLEMIDRKITGTNYHTYLQPYRFVDEGAFKVHGISDKFLADKPRFKDVCDSFMHFIDCDEIIAHNAQFDIGFLSHELSLVGHKTGIQNKITCTKDIAQRKFGRGGNKLDELCDRFKINRENRILHGALIDCELLAEVYLKLTETSAFQPQELDDDTF